LSEEDFRLDNPTLVRWEFASEDMRQFLAANTTRAHLAASVPATLDEPVPVRTHHTVFVAEKAA